MAGRAHGERLVTALVVTGVCLGAFLWAGTGSDPHAHETIGVFALLIGSGAVLVAAFSGLALLFGGLEWLSKQPRARASERAYRAETAARDDRRRTLEAGRERHRAHRAAWLRRAREWIAKDGPAWQGGSRDAFVWLRARLGTTVTVRRRQEDRVERYHWGFTGYRPNVGEPEAVAPGEWQTSTWVVELPDDALTAKEYDDRVDEADIVVRWRVADAATLPLADGVTVTALGVEIRVHVAFDDLNDLGYGDTGTYTDVIQIADGDTRA